MDYGSVAPEDYKIHPSDILLDKENAAGSFGKREVEESAGKLVLFFGRRKKTYGNRFFSMN